MKLTENPRCVTTEFFPNACGKCEPCSTWSAAVRQTLEDVARDLDELCYRNGFDVDTCLALAARYRAKAKEV